MEFRLNYLGLNYRKPIRTERIYGVYDLSNKEQCVCVGTLEELVKKYNWSPRKVNKLLKTKKISNNLILEFAYEEEI